MWCRGLLLVKVLFYDLGGGFFLIKRSAGILNQHNFSRLRFRDSRCNFMIRRNFLRSTFILIRELTFFLISTRLFKIFDFAERSFFDQPQTLKNLTIKTFRFSRAPFTSKIKIAINQSQAQPPTPTTPCIKYSITPL